MLQKVFKLREIFSAVAKENIDALKEQRRLYMKQTGNSGECWATYTEPSVTAYCPDNSLEIDIARRRISILICPGGGYEMVSFREAEPVALAFTALGYNAFVLNYEVAPMRYPQALLEVSAAVALIRDRAKVFNADADKIAVLGFSAGGHLAASLGVFWDEPFLREALGIEQGSNRPNAMALGYPVICSGRYAHRGSYDALLGENSSPEMLSRMSLDLNVNEKTPPTFIWHTFEDDTVPVENSLLLARALREHAVPFELHIFPWGGHGLSLCNKTTSSDAAQINPHCANWLQMCHEWLQLLFNK
jgi:acetyl esterase/lipase